MTKSLHMKSTLLILFALACSLSQAANNTWVGIKSAVPVESKPTISGTDRNLTEITLQLQGYYTEEISTPRGNAIRISTPGATPLLMKGAPDVPKYALSVAIPDLGNTTVEIISERYEELTNIELAPSKGNLSRTLNPSDVPYTYSSVYDRPEFFPAKTTALRDPYIVRDFRGQTVLLQPFQYNPVTKTLRIYTELKIRVKSVPSETGINELFRTNTSMNVDPVFASIYATQFKNPDAIQYTPLSEEGRMIIICHDAWLQYIQPFADWKIQRGVPVTVVPVSTIGVSSTAIQAYIANQYLTNGLTYVLLVGDEGQIPSMYAQGGASDPSYGYIVGNDSYQEVFIGRFSAETPEDVTVQVNKIIYYERDANTSDSWLSQGVAIGSNQGPGDDNEMDWEHQLNMRTDLLNFTYTTVNELYDGTHPGTTDQPGDPNNIDVFNLFQSGLGIMNYTGHGSTTACSTTGLSNTDVANMTNVNKLPFIWSVACVNGEFNSPGGPCLAEAFLRSHTNLGPTGAVSTFMSSINQSWNPPMDAQDEMVDLLVNQYPTNVKHTFAGISENGCMHMNDQYGVAGVEMTDTWHVFGDPSLLVRTATPQVITVNHAPVAYLGSTSLSVTCNYDSANVTLSMNGDILGTGTIVNGNVNLNFNPLNAIGSMTLTVTGFNLQTYQGVLQIIPASGPYVVSSAATIADPAGNNNQLADFSETVEYSPEISNPGLADANGLTIICRSNDAYITMIDSTESVASLVTGGSQVLSSGFSFSVASDVPDQHVALFTLIIEDAGMQQWTSYLSVVVNAPSLETGLLTIDDATGGDGDGILEAGESATAIIECINSGHSNTVVTNGMLTTASAYLNISNPSASVAVVPAQSTVNFSFPVALSSNIAIGTPFDMNVDFTSGAYSAQHSYINSAGLILETFETNDFSSYPWQQGGTQPWITTTLQPYQGLYCVTNTDINDNESSELNISVYCPVNDSVGFWAKTSSEATYDFLRFYNDGTMQAEWSDITPWTYRSYPVTAGNHLLKWAYEKDYIVSYADDCAWLDNIRLPVGSVVTGVSQAVVQQEVNVYPNPASSVLNINLKKGKASTLITVLDLSGRVVYGETMNLQQEVKVPVTNLANGIYMLQINDGTGIHSSKFEVMKD